MTVLAEIARKHATTASLAGWIRSLPQRDDDGLAGRMDRRSRRASFRSGSASPRTT